MAVLAHRKNEMPDDNNKSFANAILDMYIDPRGCNPLEIRKEKQKEGGKRKKKS